jgi:hypothetical protein
VCAAHLLLFFFHDDFRARPPRLLPQPVTTANQVQTNSKEKKMRKGEKFFIPELRDSFARRAFEETNERKRQLRSVFSMNVMGESDGKSVVIGELESDVVLRYAKKKKQNRKGSG